MPFLNKFKLLFIIAVYLGERTQSLRKHHTKMCPRPQGPLPENPGPLPLSSLGLPSWALRLDRPVMPQYPQHLEFHVLILQVGAGHLLHALHESRGRQRLFKKTGTQGPDCGRARDTRSRSRPQEEPREHPSWGTCQASKGNLALQCASG